MEDFLVLGLIPGTTIQITFEIWLTIAEMVVLFVCVGMLHHYHTSHRFHPNVPTNIDTRENNVVVVEDSSAEVSDTTNQTAEVTDHTTVIPPASTADLPLSTELDQVAIGD